MHRTKTVIGFLLALKPDTILPWKITARAQQHFQKSLSVNTDHEFRLKLYHVKKKPFVNMFQKYRSLLRQSGKLIYGQKNQNLKVILENMDAASCKLMSRRTIRFVTSTRFKSLHLRWYGDALVPAGKSS